jgi:hypothetical protein
MNLDDAKRIDYSRPPLLWFANLCGVIANFFFKPYMKWGTFYSVEIDLKEEIDKDDIV